MALHASIRLRNIDGSDIGAPAVVRLAQLPRVVQQSLLDTIGLGYSVIVNLPPGDKGDSRCPYSLAFDLLEG
jgi:hypothetical protein